MSAILTRLYLQPAHRQVVADLSDLHKLHQRVMSLFPKQESAGQADNPAPPRQAFQVLYRLETPPHAPPTLLIQSNLAPNLTPLLPGYVLEDAFGPGGAQSTSLETLWSQLHEGQVLRFRLRANPTQSKALPMGPNGCKPRGKRVPIRDVTERLAWLARKAARSGFEILSQADNPLVREQGGQRVHGRSPNRKAGSSEDAKHLLTFEGTLFEGLLKVTELETFKRTLIEGIGHGKAYGFGLLSIAPA